MSCECSISSVGGCGGRLCIACRQVLRRYRLLRYPTDSAGQPKLNQTPTRYIVCGFSSSAGAAGSKSGTIEIPGRRDGGSNGLRLTIAADNCGGVQKNDRIKIGGVTYRVTVVKSGCPTVAVLIGA